MNDANLRCILIPFVLLFFLQSSILFAQTLESQKQPVPGVSQSTVKLTQRLERGLGNKIVSGSLMGGVIAAAITAHPVSLMVGGLVGGVISTYGSENKESLASSNMAEDQEDLFAAMSRVENKEFASTAIPERMMVSNVDPVVEKGPVTLSSSAGRVAAMNTQISQCQKPTIMVPRTRLGMRNCFYFMN